MDRQIACFTVPIFQVALARLKDPTLCRHPLAIAPLSTSRAVLHEVSPEAHAEGVRAGMPLDQARRLCPALRVIPPDPLLIQDAHQTLLDVVGRYAPLWESIRPGALLLDLTGTTRLFGPPFDTAVRIQHDVAASYRLEGVAGVGSNKLVARAAAALLQPSQLYEVRPGSERAFMAPLQVRSLPGLHRPRFRKLLERLDDLNLRTFGDLAEIPPEPLRLAVGSWALPLSRWAQGIDPSPVLPSRVQPSLEESLTLASDEIDDRRLLSHLFIMLERLCRALRRQQRICHGLTLTLRYSDQVAVSRTRRLAAETFWEVDMESCLKTLFTRCFFRRVRVRTMSVNAEISCPSEQQLSLFDADSDQAHRKRRCRLTLTLDRLRDRYGERIIRYGRDT